MNERTAAEAIAHALREYPRECCGLVVVVKGKERYVPCANVCSDPENGFEISGQEYAEVEVLGEIVALVHSHPDCGPQPSEADKVECEAYGIPWHIVGVNTVNGDKACDWVTLEPSGYRAPLVGRHWHHGVLDCYTLCKDWYERERGIVLPNFHRDDLWWEKGQDLYLENFEKAGFEVVERKHSPKIDLSKLRTGDGLLMQIRSETVNHAAIYLGDDTTIHHRMNRLSSRDMLSGYYHEATQLIVRYKG